ETPRSRRSASSPLARANTSPAAGFAQVRARCGKICDRSLLFRSARSSPAPRRIAENADESAAGAFQKESSVLLDHRLAQPPPCAATGPDDTVGEAGVRSDLCTRPKDRILDQRAGGDLAAGAN